MTWADSVTPGTFPLYVLLDLPPLMEEPCMRYANACVCKGCTRREERQRKAAPVQPWDSDDDV